MEFELIHPGKGSKFLASWGPPMKNAIREVACREGVTDTDGTTDLGECLSFLILSDDVVDKLKNKDGKYWT